MTDRAILITGGAGFIGTNLANRLCARGHQVIIYDSLARPGVERNLHWLKRKHPTRVQLVLGDVRDALDAIAGGALDVEPLLTHSLPLDELQQAFTVMRDRPDGFLKAVVRL